MHRWRVIALEMVTIMFSVLLALGVEQFRQSRNERIVGERVKETIRAEVRDNSALVRAAVSYHDSLMKDMTSGARVRLGAVVPRAEWNARLGDRSALRSLLVERLADAGNAVSPAFALRRGAGGDYRVVEMDLETPIRIAGDSVQVFIPRGIQLRSALIRNTAWETAQATGALIRMPVPLVAAMADLYQLQRNYQASADDVLRSLYDNTFTVSAMQDLMYWEAQLGDRYAKIVPLLDQR